MNKLTDDRVQFFFNVKILIVYNFFKSFYVLALMHIKGTSEKAHNNGVRGSCLRLSNPGKEVRSSG